MKKMLLILLCLSALVVSCGDGKGVELKETKANKKVEKENVQTEAYEVELSAGHYVVGIDIPAGIYDVTAIKGTGNVSSSNMFDGGINQVMGTKEDGVSTKEFKNLKLDKKDTSITVNGTAVVKLSSKAAQTKNLKPKENPAKKEYTFSSGNYVVGKDIERGIYDIIAIKGNGNISSDNMFDGGINEVFGANKDGFYVKKFKNAYFNDDVQLTVSGVTIKLVPSK
jgi:hypothetical protein